MKLLLYGVSHQTVSEEDSEKYKIKREHLTQKLTEINAFSGVHEVVIVSNDERTEFYLHVDETMFRHGDLLKYISGYSNETLETVIMESYSKFNDDVVKHLFSVSTQTDPTIEEELTILEVLDQSLDLAAHVHTSGFVLSSLFEQAVRFSLQMRALPTMKPFYQSDFSKTLRKLMREWENLEYRRFYLTGSSYTSFFMAKALFYLGASSITIGTGDVRSHQIVDTLNEWVMRVSPEPMHKVFKVGEEVLTCYQLSSADGIVFEESMADAHALLEKLETVLSFRLTKKKQVLISMLTQSISVGYSLASNGITSVSTTDLQEDETTTGLTEEEKEVAKAAFEKALELEVEKAVDAYKHTLQSFFDIPVLDKKAPFTTMN